MSGVAYASDCLYLWGRSGKGRCRGQGLGVLELKDEKGELGQEQAIMAAPF